MTITIDFNKLFQSLLPEVEIREESPETFKQKSMEADDVLFFRCRSLEDLMSAVCTIEKEIANDD